MQAGLPYRFHVLQVLLDGLAIIGDIGGGLVAVEFGSEIDLRSQSDPKPMVGPLRLCITGLCRISTWVSCSLGQIEYLWPLKVVVCLP